MSKSQNNPESLQKEEKNIEKVKFELAPIPNFQLCISKRTLKLLFFSNKDPRCASFAAGLSMTINLFEGTVKTNELSADDPSTIFIRMPIAKPDDINNVPTPGYYPTYASLSPGQKWIYLNWLQDVSKPVNIGYVFLYYYGLERHLVLGEFDLAFDEILYLRKYHSNQSFKFYSNAALAFSSLLKHRPDRMKAVSQLLEPGFINNFHLVCAHYGGRDFTARNLIDISENMSYINKRYIHSNPDLFEKVLNECLVARYNSNIFPFASRYKLVDIPVTGEILFANISFPSRLRDPNIYNFFAYAPFVDELKSVFKETHEKVKTSLRESRKQKKKAR